MPDITDAATPGTALDTALLQRIVCLLNEVLLPNGKIVLRDSDLPNFFPQVTPLPQ